jgi:uncharacterized membrane protein
MILDQIFLSNQLKQKKEISKVKDNGISESSTRSLVKTLSWRTIGTIDTIVISWLITGQIALALSIGSIELVTKMVLYFFHERIWNTIKWGK